jgi:hypothetical protein
VKSNIVRVVCAAVLAAGVTAGCAGSGLTPSASVTTAVQGWEHYFRLEWTSAAKRDGTEIDGYVYNQYGAPMGNVQLLAQALDDSNAVVAQKLTWVHGVVPGLNRSYFRISGLPPAAHYRVTVWAFDIIDTDTPSFPWRRF